MSVNPSIRVAHVLRDHLKGIEGGWPGKDELLKMLNHVPGHAIVGLHENGISVEVRSSAGFHCAHDVGEQTYLGLKLIGLVEFRVNIADVVLVVD